MFKKFFLSIIFLIFSPLLAQSKTDSQKILALINQQSANPLCLHADSWAGIDLIIYNTGFEKISIIEIIYGSGVPIAEISCHEGIEIDDSIHFDDKKILTNNGKYKFLIDGKSFPCRQISKPDVVSLLKIYTNQNTINKLMK